VLHNAMPDKPGKSTQLKAHSHTKLTLCSVHLTSGKPKQRTRKLVDTLHTRISDNGSLTPSPMAGAVNIATVLSVLLSVPL